MNEELEGHLLESGMASLLVVNGKIQNPLQPNDTSGDGIVSGLDALLVINQHNRSDGNLLTPFDGELTLDVDGNNGDAYRSYCVISGLLAVNSSDVTQSGAGLIG